MTTRNRLRSTGQFLRTHLRAAVAGLLAIVLVAVGLVAYNSTSSKGVDQAVRAATGGEAVYDGVHVRFPAGGLDRDTHVHMEWAKQSTEPDITWIGKAVSVSIGSAHLRRPAQVVLPFDAKTPFDRSLSFLFHQDDKGLWENEGGVIDETNHTVTSTVTHFSKLHFGSLGKLVRFGDAAKSIYGAYEAVRFTAKDPECTPESQLWKATAPNYDAIKVCAQAGTADLNGHGLGTVKLNNARLYAQFVRLNGYDKTIAPVDYGGGDDALTEEAWKLLSKIDRNFTLLPGGTDGGKLELSLPLNVSPVVANVVQATEATILQVVSTVMADVHMGYEAAAGVAKCWLDSGKATEIKELANVVSGCVIDEYDVLDNAIEVANEEPPKPEAATPAQAEPESDTPAEKEDRKLDKAKLVKVLTDALNLGPEVVDNLIRGTEQQVSAAKGKPQQVEADRTDVYATKDWAGDALPSRIIDREQALQKAGFASKTSLDGINGQVPDEGLLFSTASGGAVDKDMATALGPLMMTTPQYDICPETGRQGFVYGGPDTEGLEGGLKALGWNDEAASFLVEASRQSDGYRLCIGDDGRWQSMVKVSTAKSIAATVAALPKSDGTACPQGVAGALVPNDATCVAVADVDVNGKAANDKVIVYDRGTSKGLARVVLDGTRVYDINPVAGYDGTKAARARADDVQPLSMKDLGNGGSMSGDHLPRFGPADLKPDWSKALAPLVQKRFDLRMEQASLVSTATFFKAGMSFDTPDQAPSSPDACDRSSDNVKGLTTGGSGRQRQQPSTGTQLTSFVSAFTTPEQAAAAQTVLLKTVGDCAEEGFNEAKAENDPYNLTTEQRVDNVDASNVPVPAGTTASRTLIQAHAAGGAPLVTTELDFFWRQTGRLTSLVVVVQTTGAGATFPVSSETEADFALQASRLADVQWAYH